MPRLLSLHVGPLRPTVLPQLLDQRGSRLLHSGVVRQSCGKPRHSLGQHLCTPFSFKLDVLDGLLNPRMASPVVLLERIALVHKVIVPGGEPARRGGGEAGVVPLREGNRGQKLTAIAELFPHTHKVKADLTGDTGQNAHDLWIVPKPLHPNKVGDQIIFSLPDVEDVGGAHAIRALQPQGQAGRGLTIHTGLGGFAVVGHTPQLVKPGCCRFKGIEALQGGAVFGIVCPGFQVRNDVKTPAAAGFLGWPQDIFFDRIVWNDSSPPGYKKAEKRVQMNTSLSYRSGTFLFFWCSVL